MHSFVTRAGIHQLDQNPAGIDAKRPTGEIDVTIEQDPDLVRLQFAYDLRGMRGADELHSGEIGLEIGGHPTLPARVQMYIQLVDEDDPWSVLQECWEPITRLRLLHRQK